MKPLIPITKVFEIIEMDEKQFFDWTSFENSDTKIKSKHLKNLIIEFINSDTADPDNPIFLKNVEEFFNENKDKYYGIE